VEKDCIDNAVDFLNVWNSYGVHKPDGPLRCISQKLFGSFWQCSNTDQDTLYPGNAEKAWIFSKATLEQLLYLQYRDGLDPEKMAAAGFVLIGFGPPALDDAIEGWCLQVFTMPEDVKDQAAMGLIPVVPTAASWFYHLSTQNFSIDLEVQKEISLAYNSVGKNNVVDVFSKLTNCSVSDILTKNNPFTSKGTCFQHIQDMYTELSEYGEQGVDACVPIFMTNAKGLWNVGNAGDVRMMLNLCYDVNPYITLIGWGWNAYPNPVVARHRATRRTGRSILARNT